MSFRYKMDDTFERCLYCGKQILPNLGRPDRKFCCQDCKNKYHNAGRRQVARRYHDRVSRILESNNLILRHLLTMGVHSIDRGTLVALRFNFEYATSYCKLGHRQHYTCYEIHYDLTPSRVINIENILDDEDPSV